MESSLKLSTMCILFNMKGFLDHKQEKGGNEFSFCYFGLVNYFLWVRNLSAESFGLLALDVF